MSKISAVQILEIIQKANLVKDAYKLDHKMTLQEQGVDSLDFSNLLFNIEESFGVEIPDEDIDQLHSVNEILDYVNKKLHD